jgi:hypothetical protein
MKELLITTCMLFAAGTLFGQTAAQTAPKRSSVGAPAAASSQDLNIRAYIELLRTDIKKGKARIMGDVMQLDADQAARFWPVYKAFEAELAQIGDQTVAVIKTYAANYENLTPPVADEIAVKVLGIEQQRCDLKKKYYQQFKTALDPVTAARFLQVENQLERLIDLQIAADLPVIGSR